MQKRGGCVSISEVLMENKNKNKQTRRKKQKTERKAGVATGTDDKNAY